MEKHDHRHKEELLQQMRRQAEIRPEQNDSGTCRIFRYRYVQNPPCSGRSIIIDDHIAGSKGKCFAGISMDQVLHYITDEDYGTYLKTWVETAVNGSQAL